jgi:hypothetical protein
LTYAVDPHASVNRGGVIIASAVDVARRPRDRAVFDDRRGPTSNAAVNDDVSARRRGGWLLIGRRDRRSRWARPASLFDPGVEVDVVESAGAVLGVREPDNP